MSGLPEASALEAWSRKRREPDWLRERRLAALARAAELGAAGALPEDNPLRAPLAAPELAAQGVDVLTLRAAVEKMPEVVERALPGPSAGETAEEAAQEALWSDGYFARAPAGVRAAVPVQLGSDLARAARERTLIVVEDGAELSLVEGCAGGSGAAPERHSLLDAVVGAGGSLRAASVQAWPPSVSYRALKRVRAGRGAKVDWLDGNLGARETDKRLRFILEEDARVRAELAGLAAAGQTQRLEALAEGRGSAELSSRSARAGGKLRCYLLAAREVSVRREERELDLHGLAGEQLFYLATRGLEGPAARAAVAHAFFEPFAGRLPLEFSVEFTRLLDAELTS